MFNLYEPIQSNNYRILNEFEYNIIGSMLIQFSYEEKNNNLNFNIEKIHNGEGYSPVNSFSFNENKINNDYNLLDY